MAPSSRYKVFRDKGQSYDELEGFAVSSPLNTPELGLLAAGVSKELDCSGNDIPERLHWARFER